MLVRAQAASNWMSGRPLLPRNSTNLGTQPDSITSSMGGFFILERDLRILVAAAIWSSGFCPFSCIAHAAMSLTGLNEPALVTSLKASSLSESEISPTFTTCRRFCKDSSRFCLRISTVTSSRRLPNCLLL
eukprot:Lithocolla_globosa_v1_NODE_3630_length_1620_cov_25.512460.p2 type:complete len:131 gc:universal NODE_3630_length_1620_cov_25.512460:1140-1532(+)